MSAIVAYDSLNSTVTLSLTLVYRPPPQRKKLIDSGDVTEVLADARLRQCAGNGIGLYRGLCHHGICVSAVPIATGGKRGVARRAAASAESVLLRRT